MAKQLITQKANFGTHEVFVTTIVGFWHEMVKATGVEVLTGYDDVGNILFVSSYK